MRIRIVVPCYNEETRLDAAAFDAFIASAPDVGLILVNDGSHDATLRVLQALEARWPARVSVVDQQPNRGKAEAVRVGVLRALELGCTYVGYFDADLAAPLAAVHDLAAVLDAQPSIEIVLGARLRLLGRVIVRNASRHYFGRVFATAASLVLDLPVYDTQCGAKLLRVDARIGELFARPFGVGWTFDVELLARFLAQGGSRQALYEEPLRAWTEMGESKVRPWDFVRAIGEMAFLYRTYRLRRSADGLLWLLSLPILRYISGGALGTLVHYGLLALSVEVFGLTATVGTGLGALFGAIVNYLFNYHLTFTSRAPHLQTAPRFFAIAGLLALFNVYGMAFAVNWLHLHYLLAQVGCTVAGVFVGYVLNKFWTFRR